MSPTIGRHSSNFLQPIRDESLLYSAMDTKLQERLHMIIITVQAIV